MVTAQVEDVTPAVIEELQALFPKHYSELSEHKLQGIPLDPQYDIYLKRASMGQMLYISLRDEGALIGYLVSFVAPGMHYKGCLTCTGDIFFVMPTRRGGVHGKMLFETWLKECKRRGIRLAQIGIKSKHARFARRLIESLGFEETEITFWKFLDQGDA